MSINLHHGVLQQSLGSLPRWILEKNLNLGFSLKIHHGVIDFQAFKTIPIHWPPLIEGISGFTWESFNLKDGLRSKAPNVMCPIPSTTQFSFGLKLSAVHLQIFPETMVAPDKMLLCSCWVGRRMDPWYCKARLY